MGKQKSKRYNKHSRRSQRSRRPRKRQRTRGKRKARGITKTLKSWFSGRKSSPGTPLHIRRLRALERQEEDERKRNYNKHNIYKLPREYKYYNPSPPSAREIAHWEKYHNNRIAFDIAADRSNREPSL